MQYAIHLGGCHWPEKSGHAVGKTSQTRELIHFEATVHSATSQRRPFVQAASGIPAATPRKQSRIDKYLIDLNKVRLTGFAVYPETFKSPVGPRWKANQRGSKESRPLCLSHFDSIAHLNARVECLKLCGRLRVGKGRTPNQWWTSSVMLWAIL